MRPRLRDARFVETEVNVTLEGAEFAASSALAEHARRRLRFVLTRHSGRIRRVLVRLGIENDPRGGADKFCRIRVHFVDATEASIHEPGSELCAMLDRAIDRVGRQCSNTSIGYGSTRNVAQAVSRRAEPDIAKRLDMEDRS